ncbi:molybdopterin-dependent oxidoreductase [Candidatus Bathyarchaeota archaeon]|nr:molybdopterin-dependent oxidoreductase [Candidatus Bathyarchaeota archaeon]
MKKRNFQTSLLLIAVGVILSSSLNGVITLEASETGVTSTSGNSGWTLRIDIESNETVILSLDDLAAMPKTIVQADLFCEGEYLTGGAWGGVKLGDLLENVGFNGSTADLQFYASDGYTTTYSFSDATPENVIIAYELGGSGLQEKLRLVIPGANGEAWIALIAAITINGPTYIPLPNPHAASIVPDQPSALQPSPTPKPSPTSEPKDQTTPQPTDSPPANQQAQQQDTSSYNIQTDYNQLALPAIIIAATVATGYLLYKRRK